MKSFVLRSGKFRPAKRKTFILRNMGSWCSQHPYDEPHLCGRVPSCGRRHARFLQLLLQSGRGTYPFVELLDGCLLLHTVYIHACQFALAVAAHHKGFLYNIFIGLSNT